MPLSVFTQKKREEEEEEEEEEVVLSLSEWSRKEERNKMQVERNRSRKTSIVVLVITCVARVSLKWLVS